MTKTPSPSRPREIVIVGGGLIGVSTAYHLSRHPDLPPESRITLVEENNVGTGSSGYASGLLVRNQDDELSTIGFDLHKTLARDYGGELKWGYKPIDFYNATLNPSNTSTSNGHPSSSPSVPFLPSTAQIDHPHPHSPNTTAIINPSELTRHLCGLFLTHPGGSLRIARATSLTFDNQKSSRRVVNGINIVQIINSIEEIVHLRADTIVLCTGIKTPSLLGTFLGGEVPGLDVGRRDWEGLVLKTKQKHRPCAVMIRHNQEEEEGAGEVTLVVRDDGKIMV
nr:hypothetical protein I302_04467 [Kwoniella bestiolae CBS 10118]OCF26778.1 hypothetical protein I302_04467 [Kwoniella bestiolae CBS 10118]